MVGLGRQAEEGRICIKRSAYEQIENGLAGTNLHTYVYSCLFIRTYLTTGLCLLQDLMKETSKGIVKSIWRSLLRSFDYSIRDTMLLCSGFHIKTFSFTFDPTLLIQSIDKIP